MDPILVYAAGDLDTAGIPVDRELPPAWLAEHLADVEARADGSGHVDGRLSRSGTDNVVVRCDARASITVPCARCLGPAPVELRADISLLLVPGKVLPEPARVVKPEESRPTDVAKKRPAGPGSEAIAAARTLRAAKGAAAGRRAPGALGRSAGAGAATAARRGAERSGRGQKLPEYEFSPEEADHDLYDGDTVVLDGFVREALLLEMPNFPLCSEDCPGIAAVPAAASDVAAGSAGPATSPPSGDGDDRAERPPGTRSLGDALRAALSRKDDADRGSSKTKKR